MALFGQGLMADQDCHIVEILLDREFIITYGVLNN